MPLKLNYQNVNYASPGLASHKPKDETDTERGYTLGKWQELVVFRCCLCPQDSFNESEIAHHVFTRHHQADPPSTRPPSALLFDANGHEVKAIPVTPKTAPAPPPDPDDAALDAALEAQLPELLKSGLAEYAKGVFDK